VATLPTLVVVSGPAGAGKTTLAHRIAEAVGCPVICRDEIKEGMVHTSPGLVPGPGDELTRAASGAASPARSGRPGQVLQCQPDLISAQMHQLTACLGQYVFI
jgi:predicted kinase